VKLITDLIREQAKVYAHAMFNSPSDRDVLLIENAMLMGAHLAYGSLQEELEAAKEVRMRV